MFPPRPRANAPPPQQPPNANNHRQQQLANIRVPELNEVGTIIISGIGIFARKNKIITSYYLLGVVVLLYVSAYGGRQLTNVETNKYNKIMNSIDLQVEYDALDQYIHAKHLYQQTKGWLWSCDTLCQRNKKRMEQSERTLNQIRQEGNARMSDAKKIAGLSSDIAINEMKDSFWQYFTSGKQFAKRQSMWDIMFMGIRTMSRGRDESTVEFMLKALMQVLMNFTLGLIMALIFFIIGLWNIIKTYQSNPIIALITFIITSAGAFSFVFTYLFAVFGAAAGGVYGLIKLAESSAHTQRIGNNNRGGNGGRLHYD